MKKFNGTKLLALFLAVMMLVGILPLNVLAADDAAEEPAVVTEEKAPEAEAPIVEEPAAEPAEEPAEEPVAEEPAVLPEEEEEADAELSLMAVPSELQNITVSYSDDWSFSANISISYCGDYKAYDDAAVELKNASGEVVATSTSSYGWGYNGHSPYACTIPKGMGQK